MLLDKLWMRSSGRRWFVFLFVFFFQAEDGIRDKLVTGVQTCALPIFHRALGSIVQRQDEGLNVRVGARFARRLNTELLEKEAALLKPRRTERLRETRRIELVNGSPVLQYDQTDYAGVYEVKVADPAYELKFAAQQHPSESSMDELTLAQVNNLKTAANVVAWTPGFTLKGFAERDRTGFEFWLPIVIGALMVPGAETFLGQWFSREK